MGNPANEEAQRSGPPFTVVYRQGGHEERGTPESDEGAARELGRHLSHALADQLTPHHDGILVVAIGTDRSTGDALGPLVGSSLTSSFGAPTSLDSLQETAAGQATPWHLQPKILGTVHEPVHATNLQGTLDRLTKRYKNPFVVAVDACLGQSEHVGTLTLGIGRLRPGAGVNKELPEIGNVHITGTVNVGGFMEYFVLQNTRLSLVLRMARTISSAIQMGLKEGLTTAAGENRKSNAKSPDEMGLARWLTRFI